MAIKVENINFAYIKDNILKDISFCSDNNNIIAILGQNGSGKSTLLKCINGILKYQAGQIFIDKQNLKDINNNTKAKLISYVPQEITFGDFSVFDAILMGRKPYIKFNATSKDLQLTSDIIFKFHIENKSLNNVNELSGGEKQKVAIARCLLQEANVVLFDEPTSNLDLKNQLEVINIIKEIAKDNKIVIVTMHDLNLALRFANKFIFLKDGMIYKMGDQSIINKDLIKNVYDVEVEIVNINNQLVILPK